jgi:hypothetical protein
MLPSSTEKAAARARVTRHEEAAAVDGGQGGPGCCFYRAAEGPCMRAKVA